jgi:CHAT domain-containing protein
MFTDHTPKLVVLNACRTAEAGEGLAGLAAALVQQAGLPAVVGMGYPISTSAAAIFSKAFYETLVRQGQVDYAVAQGRAALAAAIGAGKRDCGVPRLYIRTPASVVFEMR